MNLRVKNMFFLSWLLLTSASIHAHQDPVISDAKKLMDDAEYTKAQHIISRGLSRSTLSAKNKIDLYWLQGICYISSDRADLTKSSFLKLLALEPMFESDTNISPKILNAFLDAKSQFSKAGGFDLIYKPQLIPIEDHHRGKTKVVHFTIGNQERVSDVSRVVLYMRKQGNSAYASLDLSPDIETKGLYLGNFSSNLLSLSSDSYAIEYYIEALSAESSRLTGIGNHQLPLSFVIIADENNASVPQLISSSQTFHWPHWLGIGTMVFGGIVLGIVSLSSPSGTSIKITVKQP